MPQVNIIVAQTDINSAAAIILFIQALGFEDSRFCKHSCGDETRRKQHDRAGMSFILIYSDIRIN